MKRSIFFILLGVVYFFSPRFVSASALEGAECKFEAKVMYTGIITRELSGSANQPPKQYQAFYLTLRVQNVEKLWDSVGCDFIKVDDVFESTGGNNLEFFQKGDIVEGGVSKRTSNGPSGTVSFLDWEPIWLADFSRSQPYPLSIETDIEPENRPLYVQNNNQNLNQDLNLNLNQNLNQSIAVEPYMEDWVLPQDWPLRPLSLKVKLLIFSVIIVVLIVGGGGIFYLVQRRK